PLVAARAECLVAGAREDDRSNLEIVAGARERVPELGKRLWAERIAALGPVDRDLGDPLGLLVQDVLEIRRRMPLDRRVELLAGRCVLVGNRHVRDYPWR